MWWCPIHEAALQLWSHRETIHGGSHMPLRKRGWSLWLWISISFCITERETGTRRENQKPSNRRRLHGLWFQSTLPSKKMFHQVCQTDRSLTKVKTEARPLQAQRGCWILTALTCQLRSLTDRHAWFVAFLYCDFPLSPSTLHFPFEGREPEFYFILFLMSSS